jgi:translation initiation factor 2B subunit (eIF-2B alpha/beta/delta family)
MASVRNVALMVLGASQAARGRDPLGAAARSAQRMAFALEAARPAIARFARPYMRGTAVTLSFSSTVLETLLAHRDRLRRVVVAEGRPRQEGRLLAARLAEEGLPVELATEAQIPLAMAEADLALIGAGCFLADGSAVNKVGSCLLALSARQERRPFFVLADTLKLAPWTPEAPPPGVWEEGEWSEVWPEAPEGLRVRNAIFEAVPAALITKYITEDGIREPEQMAALAGGAARLWASLDATE